MKVAVVREVQEGERRVAIVPESVRKLVKAGFAVAVQAGAGVASSFPDEAYREAGATVETDARALLGSADLLLKIHPPRPDETDALRAGAVVLCSFVPSRSMPEVQRMAERQVTAFSTDLIPRITRAQTMDTLSSMSSIAGYKAVLIAANLLPKYFPMFMSAAGTVLPAKVFVIGAGVAGLQAIATARRLGAAVEATDTRPAAKQDIESLGAKYVGVTAEEAQDKTGYAKELSQEFYAKQAELVGVHCAGADVVITTALIGGVKAPKLVTAEMVKHMRPGSVIVDLAAIAGGNCELTVPGQTVEREGVTIAAPLNLPSDMAVHGSTLFSRNLTSFVTAFSKDGTLALDFADEVLKGAAVTHGGEVVHPPTKEALARQEAAR
jgi:NAD(P) transhydrogenase subunit alpha